MRKRLVNHQSEPRRLNPLAKIFLALFALLLTPNLAWAQTITVAGSGPDENGNFSTGITSGSVTFDATTSTLTLNNATIIPEGENFGITYTGTANLTISLKGTNNFVKGIGGCSAILYNGNDNINLIFTQGDTEACSLQLEAVGTQTINGFSSVIGLIKLEETIPGDETTTYRTTIASTILGGGSGTDGDPFLIKTKEDLAAFANYVNNGAITTQYVNLDNNINCSELTGFTPIGNSTHPFIGTFANSDNYTISNLNCTAAGADGYIGLFGVVGLNGDKPVAGSVSGLILDHCSFSGGNVGGAIAGYLRYGTINNCQVTNSSVSTNNGDGPISAGIAGESFGTITNCTVSGCTITASTTSGSNSLATGGVAGSNGGTIRNCEVTGTTEHPTLIKSINSGAEGGPDKLAGGIVGYCINDNSLTKTISYNSVKGVTTVDCEDTGNAAQAGAIIGHCPENINITLMNNFYEYTVETIIKNNNVTDERTDYEQRGNGDFVYDQGTQTNVYTDITANNGAVMYTKIVSLPDINNAIGTVTGAEGTYYKKDGTSLYVAPGQTAKINATPNTANNYALAWLQTVKTGTSYVISCDSTEITGGGRQYTFEMPDAEVTVNVSWGELYNLWIGDTQVTSANAAHILGEGNTTVSFTAADPQQAGSANTLTLNGATLTVPVKVGLASLTIDIQGTNSITTAETCIQNTLNTVGTTPAVTFKSTSTEKGSLILKNTSGDLTGVNNIGVDDKGSFTISDELALVLKRYGYIYSNQYYFTDGSTLEAILSPSYGVTIGGMQICKDNAADVIGEGIGDGDDSGMVSFNKETNTLTLNNADISGTISTSLTTLTVELVGNNTISAGGNPALQSSSGNAVSINIQSTAEERGNLTMNYNTGGDFFDNHVTMHIIDPLDVVSGSWTESTVTIGEYYKLDVAGTKVTYLNKDNVLGDDKITFTPSSNTLTLNGATINGSIWYNGTEDLTIALNGINSVTNTYGTYAIYTNGGDFNFVKADGASSAELTAICGDGYTPVGLYNSTLGSGLYWLPIAQNQTIITEDPDFVLVGGYVINHGDTKTGTSGTITYTVNGSEKTLTFTNYQKTFGDGSGEVNAIETGIEGLKVILVGENTITCDDPDTYAFKGIRDGASIQFVKGGDGCNLTMNMTNTTNPFSFADGKVTYDGLVYYPTGKYIAIPPAPVMGEVGNNKVMITKGNYEGGTIKYSIDYADDTEDVTGATYSEPFAVAAPGTVTAWVETDGATTDEAKGKYFGYKDAPFTLGVGDTKIPELIPAFEDGDNIGYKATGTYESSTTGVATFDGGTITATGIGTATLTANIEYTSDVHPVVILNPSLKVTAEVNVGTIPDITFTDGMTYATYCNTTGYDLTVPEGLKAYAVTGTNGDVVTLAEVGFLPKVDGTDYVALLLKREDTSAAVGLALVSAGGTRPTTNCLMYNYTTADITTTGYEYVLYKEEFLKATGTIPNGKCYLNLSDGAAPARASYGISHGEGIGTGIDNLVFHEDGTEKWYDLRGRRIEKPTKAGLYIRNGEKIVVNDNNK